MVHAGRTAAVGILVDIGSQRGDTHTACCIHTVHAAIDGQFTSERGLLSRVCSSITCRYNVIVFVLIVESIKRFCRPLSGHCERSHEMGTECYTQPLARVSKSTSKLISDPSQWSGAGIRCCSKVVSAVTGFEFGAVGHSATSVCP